MLSALAVRAAPDALDDTEVSVAVVVALEALVAAVDKAEIEEVTLDVVAVAEVETATVHVGVGVGLGVGVRVGVPPLSPIFHHPAGRFRRDSITLGLAAPPRRPIGKWPNLPNDRPGGSGATAAPAAPPPPLPPAAAPPPPGAPAAGAGWGGPGVGGGWGGPGVGGG